MNRLKCRVCGFGGMNLVTHLKFKHSLSVDDYRKQYGQCQVYLHSDELRKKISKTLKKLNENPEFRLQNSQRQKNGASCLTIKYWTNKGLSDIEAREEVSTLQKQNSLRHLSKNDLQKCSHFSEKYWIERGRSPIEAKKEVSTLQTTLSARSSKFTGHIRTDDQKERIASSVKKMINKIGKGTWAKHFGNFNGRSKVEIQFYNYIKENIDASVEANVPIGHYIVDVIKEKKIIEFYGDFWHANPSIFSECKKLYPYGKNAMLVKDIWEKDNIRISYLKNKYNVLIIWESEWNKHKEKCVDKIRKYLL